MSLVHIVLEVHDARNHQRDRLNVSGGIARRNREDVVAHLQIDGRGRPR